MKIDLPTWATRVIARTERHATGISYAVSLADDDGANEMPGCGDEGGHRLCVWEREVFFGATDATCSGGSAFVTAARLQDDIAARCADGIRLGLERVAS